MCSYYHYETKIKLLWFIILVLLPFGSKVMLPHPYMRTRSLLPKLCRPCLNIAEDLFKLVNCYVWTFVVGCTEGNSFDGNYCCNSYPLYYWYLTAINAHVIHSNSLLFRLLLSTWSVTSKCKALISWQNFMTDYVIVLLTEKNYFHKITCLN